jgi:hypothetical protein
MWRKRILKILVTEKGFISFAARKSGGTGSIDRRESDETGQ